MTVVPASQAGRGATGARASARVAWFVRGSALLLLGAGLVLLWASPDAALPEGDRPRLEQAISLVGLLGPPLLGGLLAARRPANPYGWLWLAYGLGWAGRSSASPTPMSPTWWPAAPPCCGGPAWSPG